MLNRRKKRAQNPAQTVKEIDPSSLAKASGGALNTYVHVTAETQGEVKGSSEQSG